LYASVFGSAARGDGDESSDIDLMLIHPPLPGEKQPARISPSLRSQITDALGDFALSSAEMDAARQWEGQVDRLRELVEGWTGNALQVIDLSFYEWRHPSEESRLLFMEIARDGIELLKSRALSLWQSAEATNG
jgi:predicted nucleotidyltransferase